jgi:hypothetical protein
MDISNSPQALEVDLLPNRDLSSPVTPTASKHLLLQYKEEEEEEEDEYDDEQQDYIIPKDRHFDANDTLTRELDLLSIDDANESLLSRTSDPSREKDSKTTLTLREQEKVNNAFLAHTSRSSTQIVDLFFFR